MAKKQIQKHEKKYLHIPKRSFKFILLTLLLILITIGFTFVLIDSWNFLGLSFLRGNSGLYQLMIIPMLIFYYILISLTICSFVSIFKKLKRYNEGGIILEAISGLIVGTIIGVILGLICGLVSKKTITGIIFGLSVILSVAIIAEIILGLQEEFRK